MDNPLLQRLQLCWSFESLLAVTGLTDETTSKESVTWNWDCKDNFGTCSFRHAINKSATHAFTDDDSFTSTKEATKTITATTDDGKYYIHVQTKDRNGNSPIAKGSANLKVLPKFNLKSSTPHTNTLQLYTEPQPTFEGHWHS